MLIPYWKCQFDPAQKLNTKVVDHIPYITALASATVVFIECMSMAFANEYDHVLKLNSSDCPWEVGSDVIIVRLNMIESPLQLLQYEQNIYNN